MPRAEYNRRFVGLSCPQGDIEVDQNCTWARVRDTHVNLMFVGRKDNQSEAGSSTSWMFLVSIISILCFCCQIQKRLNLSGKPCIRRRQRSTRGESVDKEPLLEAGDEHGTEWPENISPALDKLSGMPKEERKQLLHLREEVSDVMLYLLSFLGASPSKSFLLILRLTNLFRSRWIAAA